MFLALAVAGRVWGTSLGAHGNRSYEYPSPSLIPPPLILFTMCSEGPASVTHIWYVSGLPWALSPLFLRMRYRRTVGALQSKTKWTPTLGGVHKLYNFGPAATLCVTMSLTVSARDQFCHLWPWPSIPQQHVAALSGNWDQASPSSSVFSYSIHHQTERGRVTSLAGLN